MNRPTLLSRAFAVAATAALFLTGCTQYSSVSELRPTYYYKPRTPIGALISKAIQTPNRNPEALLGRYLDAAAAAERHLKNNPKDEVARQDYNFAVGRVFEVIHDAKLQPWKSPVAAPGAQCAWQFSYPCDKRPENDPSSYNTLPADRYKFTGKYVNRRRVKEGLGAPLIMYSKQDTDVTKFDKFAQGKHTYYGVTALLHFSGQRCSVSLKDPLSVENVKFAHHTFPLAADFTAPIALALAKENPKKFELARLLWPEEYASTARLARLQPYDPAKIPIICVHGLMDSTATWTPMITALRADPAIRTHYQFWFYSYPSGYPYPLSAAIMREQLDAINARYPGHKKVVLIGHSMGGIISRTMITDSGMNIWNTYYKKPPQEMRLSKYARKTLTDSLIFSHRPEVARAIFIAAPHRGSEMAGSFLGRLGAMLVKTPSKLLAIGREATQFATFDPGARTLDRIPNSVDTLKPDNRFVKAINTIPPVQAIPFNSIMGDRGKGGNLDATQPVSSDGVVPYWSSHLDGAQSELIIASDHGVHQNPQAIEEVDRILKLHTQQ